MNNINENLFDTLIGSKGNKLSNKTQNNLKMRDQDSQARKNKDLRAKLLNMGYDPDTAEIIIFRSNLEPEITELLLKNVYNYNQVALIRAIMKNQALRDYVDEDGIKLINILSQTNPSEVNLQYLIYIAQNHLPFFLILNKDFKTFKSENKALADINDYKSGKEGYSDQVFSKEIQKILDQAQRSGYSNDVFLSLKRAAGEYLFYNDETLDLNLLTAIYLSQASNVSGQDIKNVLLNATGDTAIENLVDKIHQKLGDETFNQLNQLDDLTIEKVINTSKSSLIKTLINQSRRANKTKEDENTDEIVGTIDNNLDSAEGVEDDSEVENN